MTRFLFLLSLAMGVFSELGLAQEGDFFPMWEGRRTKFEAVLYTRDGCPKKEGHYADCMQLYEQYKNVDPNGVPADMALFSSYIESLEERACPAEMLLYSIDERKVLRANTQRKAKPGERCLFNTRTNRWVASLWCGNGIDSPQPRRAPEPEVELEIPPPAPDKKITPVKIFGDSASYLIGDKLVVVRNDTTLQADENNSISIRLVRPIPPKPVMVTKTDTVYKKKTDPLLVGGAFVAGGLLGYFLPHGNGEVMCGPVNPYNHETRWSLSPVIDPFKKAVGVRVNLRVGGSPIFR